MKNQSLRIFMTGASGYLGGVLSRRLAAEGHQVRALLRTGRDAQSLEQSGVTTFAGDILDRPSMREAMSGADWVIHAAALVELDAPAAELERVNVGGSDNVASLAFKLGVGRFLSVSSIAYFGGSPEDGSPADETSPTQKPFPSAYSATKHGGQEKVRQWARQGLKVNTVYPSLIYGPPAKRGGSNAMLRAIAKGRFPALIAGDRKTSWVHVDDVVDGILRVMDRAQPGRDYLLAGEIRTIREVVREVCRWAGIGPPRFELSVGTARVLLALVSPMMRLAGKRPPTSPGQLSSLARHWAFSDERARTELSWKPRPLAEGLPPTLEFLLQ
jgi:dihydroflavonol-4-reductase